MQRDFGYGTLGQACSSVVQGDDDPTAVGIGDVVESQELPPTPANPRSSSLLGHRVDIDVGPPESRDTAEESVTGFLALEAGGSPRTKFGWRDERGELAHV